MAAAAHDVREPVQRVPAQWAGGGPNHKGRCTHIAHGVAARGNCHRGKREGVAADGAVGACECRDQANQCRHAAGPHAKVAYVVINPLLNLLAFKHMPCNTAKTKVLTVSGWVSRLYATSAALLLVSMAVFSMLSKGEATKNVMLEYAHQNTTIYLGGEAIHLGSAYTVGMVLSVVGHIVVALVPSLLDPHLSRGRNPSRWLMLLVSLPLLQVVTLVGLVGVTDVWAVFSVAAVSGMGLLVLFLLETTHHGAWTTAVVTIGVIGCFVGYWVMVWRVSGGDETFAMAMTCLLSVMLVGLFAATYQCTNRPYQREAAMQSATLLFEVGMPWLWAASDRSEPAGMTTLGTFLVLLFGGMLLTAWAVSSVDKLMPTADHNSKELLLIPPAADGDEVIIDEYTASPDAPLNLSDPL